MRIVVSIWYPAVEGTGESLSLTGYLAFRASRYSLELPGADDVSDGVDAFSNAARFVAGDIAASAARKAGTIGVYARHQAEERTGPFPVLIGGLAGPQKSGILAEWLASHGYVVATTTSPALLASAESSDPSFALNQRLATYERLLTWVSELGMADTSRLAIIGANFEGMSALLFQMRTGAAKAVLSIDGWEGKRGTKQGLTDRPDWSSQALDVSYLSILQDEEEPRDNLRLDFDVFERLHYSDRRVVVIRGLSHVPLIVPNLAALPAARHSAAGTLWEGILGFLDSNLKPMAVPDHFARPPDDSIYAINRGLAAKPAPPLKGRLIWLLRNGHEKEAIDAYKATLGDSHASRPFNEAMLEYFIRRLYRNENVNDAVALAALAVTQIPESAELHHTLGDLHRLNENSEKALASYRRALEITEKSDPEAGSELRRKIRELTP